MSSANRYVLFCIRDRRSLMYTANTKTANTEPFGSPLVTVNSDESSFQYLRSAFCSIICKKLEKLVIKSKTHKPNLHCDLLYQKPLQYRDKCLMQFFQRSKTKNFTTVFKHLTVCRILGPKTMLAFVLILQ